MERLLLECAVRAGLIAAGTGLGLRALRVRTAAARHVAWTGVVLAMLLLPGWTAWGPKAKVRVLPAVATTMDWVAPEQVGEETPATAATPMRSAAASTGIQFWDWTTVSEAVYGAGLIAFLLRLSIGTLCAHRLVRRAIRVDSVLTSGYFAAPVTVGWFRPAVILPEDWLHWPRGQLDAVMAHEREHARRRDPLVQGLALLNRAVFWFHPLAWWLERRLSRLAEESCDEAVLARGHDPRGYAAYLLELARAVERAGTRSSVLGMAMPGGFLPERIRILAADFEPRISGRRMTCMAAIIAVTAAALAACTLDHVRQRAQGQPTMNELMHRNVEEQRHRAANHNKFVEEAQQLTPAEVRALEDKVAIDPQEDESRKKLLTYYQYKPDWKARDRHLLWMLEHEPEAEWMAWPYVDPNPAPEYYEQGKRILLAHLQRPGASPRAFERAYRFVSRGGEVQLAEQILLEGRKAHPDEYKLWDMRLGGLYADVLVGERIGHAKPDPQWAHTPYADGIRSKLAVSNDAYLLAQTAQALYHHGGGLPLGAPMDFDAAGLALSYVDRALSIQPDLHLALVVKVHAEILDEWRRLARVTPEERAHASPALRIRILNKEVQDANLEGKFDEAGARELLDLAASNRTDPRYGDAIYNANIALGRDALKHGEKKKAAQYLLAAAETPGSDRLRYSQIYGVSMALPRSLVDWGEREAVAQFLERCARFCDRGEQLKKWAGEIRRGINPDLIPYGAASLL
jgi:hypothetical protein